MSPDAALASGEAAFIFAALGDVTRLSLILRLQDGQPRSVGQLTQGLGLTRQGVSKHLRVLELAGIVIRQRVGRESRYAFQPAPLVEAQNYLARVSRQWDEAAERLKAFVEKPQK